MRESFSSSQAALTYTGSAMEVAEPWQHSLGCIWVNETMNSLADMLNDLWEMGVMSCQLRVLAQLKWQRPHQAGKPTDDH